MVVLIYYIMKFKYLSLFFCFFIFPSFALASLNTSGSFIPLSLTTGQFFDLEQSAIDNGTSCNPFCSGYYYFNGVIDSGSTAMSFTQDYRSAFDAQQGGVDGVYEIELYGFSGGNQTAYFGWTRLVKSGGLWIDNTEGFDSSTRFISTIPVSGTTVATTSTIGYSVYVSDDDYVDGSYVQATFYQDAEFFCQNSGALYDALYGACPDIGSSFTIGFSETGSRLLEGYNSTSTAYTFPQGGKWVGEYKVKVPHLFGLFYTELIATSTLFTVGQLSAIDITRASIASTTRPNGFTNLLASSTAQVGVTCNPLSSGFSMGDCLLDVIYDPQGFDNNLTVLKQTAPWGYAFRFYDILTSTTTTNLVVVDATLPFFGNPHIRLDLTNSLDFILNATTSQYSNVSASSTQTFYEITSSYWKIIVYVLTAFYILGRIIGRGIIPKI